MNHISMFPILGIKVVSVLLSISHLSSHLTSTYYHSYVKLHLCWVIVYSIIANARLSSASFAKSYTANPSLGLHYYSLAKSTLLTPHWNLHPLDSLCFLCWPSVLSDFTQSSWQTPTSYTKLLCPLLNSYILHWFYSRVCTFIQNLYLLVVSMTHHKLTFILSKRPGWILMGGSMALAILPASWIVGAQKKYIKSTTFNLKLQPLFTHTSKPLPAVWGAWTEESVKDLYLFGWLACGGGFGSNSRPQ